MRPDLPWNVAGIPPEAREAARAAARREGLSVGEWLTRRIVSGLASIEAETEPMGPYGGYGTEPHDYEGALSRRDNGAMRDRVRTGESENADIYRRIEDQLRAVSRRLETAEQSQTESNRAMSRAAGEMNVAAREQAQAFDQLADHVVKLSDRMERLEQQSHGDNGRDAVKTLQQGVAKLTDQIANIASQSETQIKTLSDHMEALATKLVQIRREAETASGALETRVATLTERMLAAEAAVKALNRAPAPDYSEAIARLADSVRRLEGRSQTNHDEAITQMSESIRRLEGRGPDPSVEKRLSGIERTLGDLIGRLEVTDDDPSPRIEDGLNRLTRRMDGVETDLRDAVAQMRKWAADRIAAPPPAVAAPPPFVAAAAPTPGSAIGADALAPMPDSGPPPFVDAPQFESSAFADALNPSDFSPLPEPPQSGEPYGDSYLAAARRSAIAAQADAERHGGAFTGFSWNSSQEPDKPKRRLSVGIAVLTLVVVIAAIASTLLSHRMPLDAVRNSPLGAIVEPKPANQAAQPAKQDAAPPADAEPTPSMSAPTDPSAKPPTPSAAATGTGAGAATASAILPKLLVLAKAGNGKAALVLGLSYLDGDGVAASEVEAAKWLEAASGKGEPVAQYRLGVLLERGRGIKKDLPRATALYLSAANQGNRKAMHNLASAYAAGSGVTKDFTEAARWFQRAANLGLRDSQFNLAVLFDRGLGMTRDAAEAFKWYAIAAAAGDKEAQNRVNTLSQGMAADALAAAEASARAFKPAPLNVGANVAPSIAAFAGR